MNDVLRQKWHDLLRVSTVDRIRVGRTFEELCEHYAGPDRYYHTLAHVRNVLDVVDSLSSYVRNLSAVRLAAWLHDVIYDSRASDNEERSAEYAERLCTSFAIPAGHVVAALIRKTKTHDADGDVDAQVLLDADLAILGASEPVYRTYAGQIRQEYGWVSEPNYRTGRRQVLERFLTRPKIYHLLTSLEAPARGNIAGEIARLALP